MATIAQPIGRPTPVPKGLQPGLIGKLRRLRLFPAHTITIRLGIAQRLHARRTAKAEREMVAAGFDRLLWARDPAALPQDPADLMYLHRTVMARRPGRVIEFGSGQSTLFIAQAIHDAGMGHLWSLDADPRWIEHTRAMLPEHLRPHVTLVHSPVEITYDYGVPAWRYTVIPGGAWDFVFLDGPEHKAGVDVTVNLIELAERFNRGATGFIDHRWKTTVLTREALGSRPGIRYVPSLESFTLHWT